MMNAPHPRIRLGQQYRSGDRTVRVVAVGPQFGPPQQARSWVLGLDERGRQHALPAAAFLRRFGQR